MLRIYRDGGVRSGLLATSTSSTATRSAARKMMSLMTLVQASASTHICIYSLRTDYVVVLVAGIIGPFPPSAAFQQRTQHPGVLLVDLQSLREQVSGGLIVDLFRHAEGFARGAC